MDIPILTIIVPNRDRMSPDSKGTEFHLESIKRQTLHNFNYVLIDGGSKNFTELSEYVKSKNIPNLSIMQRVLEGKWHKTLLNNYAIRRTDTSYIMTTDADIFFAKEFVEVLSSYLNPSEFIESRTLYWKDNITSKIYRNELDPFNNLEVCKNGRIKKRTTPGGCQCGHRDIWEKIRGYDERYVGWGSEDVDLLRRVGMAGYKTKWLGENRETIMVFHQPHGKIDYNEDMRDQNRNLGFYNSVKTYEANANGWGDK